MRPFPILCALTVLILVPGPALLAAPPADVADVPAEKVSIGKDPRKSYVRIGPVGDAKTPEKGHPLLVILPGGDGSEGFQTFCQRILKNACPEGWLAAQVIAPEWNDKQVIVWPTKESKVKGMRFTTEALVEAVIADASKWKKIDPSRIQVLAWSSSGPAVWALSFSKKPTPRRYLIAMSVFKEKELPGRPPVKGRSWYVLHSEEDRMCPFWMVKKAKEFLEKRKARVTLKTYAGGHGWKGNVYGMIREGMTWLEKE